eukprot:m.75693 g.75693  ORF g.75693 m.75693 type:complete len:973 (+) comp35946_c1_seq2:295-3213(+)
MPDLRVAWKLSVEFDSFSNLDLFQRGYYQVRCQLKGSPGLSCIFHLDSDGGDVSGRLDYVFPASVGDGGKVFQSSVVNVQFRKEDFSLNEVATADVSALVDGGELPDSIPLPLLELEMSLFFAETSSGLSSVDDMKEISSRCVELHFDSSNNIHHRLPLLFDYFHLASANFTVHSFLSGVKSTMESSPPEKHWFGLFSSQPTEGPPEPTLPKLLFPNDVKVKKKKRSFRGKLHRSKSSVPSFSTDHAVSVHRVLCDILLSSLEGLVSSFRHLMSTLPQSQQISIAIPDKSSKLDILGETLKKSTRADSIVACVEQNLDELSSEASVLWAQYVEVVSLNPCVIKTLAEEHDYLTMSRFLEATIVYRWPREIVSRIPPKCKYPHLKIAEAMHRAHYMQQAVAPLPLSCAETEGTPTSMPIVFEDHFDATPPQQYKQEQDVGASSTSLRALEGSTGSSRSSIFLENGDEVKQESAIRSRSSSRLSDVHPSLRHSVSLPQSMNISTGASSTLTPPLNGKKHNRRSSGIPKPSSSSCPGNRTHETPNGSVPAEEDSAIAPEDETAGATATAVVTSEPQPTTKKRREPPAPVINGTELDWLIPHELADIDFTTLPPEFVQEILESAATALTKERLEAEQEREKPPPLPPRRRFSPSARDKKLEPAKGELREMLTMNGCFLSDFPNTSLIHTNISSPVSAKGFLKARVPTHIVVCVHGLEGNCNDLRTFRTFLELAVKNTRLEFIMSEVNQDNTFGDFKLMTDLFVNEVIHHIEAFNVQFSKISFIGHSLGNIIIRAALQRPEFEPLLDKMHTFLSLSGPHLGMLYNPNSLVSTGMWLAQKWKKSLSLAQLALKDHPDPRKTFIYHLSHGRGLSFFRHILLVSSVQDQYVPYHSARIEMCRAAEKDSSDTGCAYKEMLHNLLQPIKDNPKVSLVRFNVVHHLPGRTADNFIGRAAHIAMLDSEVFIQKFILANGQKYFV